MKRLLSAICCLACLFCLTALCAPTSGILRESTPRKSRLLPLYSHAAALPEAPSPVSDADTDALPEALFLPPITWPIIVDVTFCQAAVHNTIDTAFAQYNDYPTILMLTEYTARWDEVIDTTLSALQEHLTEADSAVLLASHDSWRAWRDSGTAQLICGYDQMGSALRLCLAGERATRTRDRAIELWSYLYILTDSLDFIA